MTQPNQGVQPKAAATVMLLNHPVEAASPEREVLDRVSAYIAEFKPRCYSDNAGLARRTAFQEIEDLISALSLPVQSVEGEAATFQERAGQWVVACFGDIVACDELERMDRAVEEFYEGLQARNYPRERLSALEDYTWSRPVGEITQEFGGIMMTLAAWAQAIGVDMHACAETELARVWTKVEQIRAKQAAKPVGSALPIAAPPKPSEAPAMGWKVTEAMVERAAREFSGAPFPSHRSLTKARAALAAAMLAAPTPESAR